MYHRVESLYSAVKALGEACDIGNLCAGDACICNSLCAGRSVLYISGEESKSQLKLRAKRIGVESKNLYIAPYTDIGQIVNAISSEKGE